MSQWNQYSAAAPLTVTRRRRGNCGAQIGHSHTGHYLWCKYIQWGIWAASLSVRLLKPSWQRRPKPGASILSIPSLLCPGVPFLVSRPRSISPPHATSRQNPWGLIEGFKRQFCLFSEFVLYISVSFALIIDCPPMQVCVYASCVSIGRHQSSGFVLQGAGLQMRDRQGMRAAKSLRYVYI